MIYMRQDTIGGISVRHNQQYIDENSNYDDLWERFVTITNMRNGYEFAFDEVNETIYWTQIKGFLPDGTARVRNSYQLTFIKKNLYSKIEYEHFFLCCKKYFANHLSKFFSDIINSYL